MQCARMGGNTLIDLEQAGMKILEEAAKPIKPTKPSWFRRWRN
jgi:hypothetical protein